jgi:hypothetical protein
MSKTAKAPANGASGKEVGRLSSASDLIRRKLIAPLLKQHAAEVDEARRPIAAARQAAIARKNGPEAKKLGESWDAARAARQKLEQQLETAKQQEHNAAGAVASHCMACELEVSRCEVDLRATCDSRISDALEQLHEELAAMGLSSVWRHFTQKQGEARRAALLAAIDATEALQYVVGINVEEALAKLRESIPERPQAAGQAAYDRTSAEPDALPDFLELDAFDRPSAFASLERDRREHELNLGRG